MTIPGPIFGEVERERDRWERHPYGRWCPRCGEKITGSLCEACLADLEAEAADQDARRERAREAEEELQVDEKRDRELEG